MVGQYVKRDSDRLEWVNPPILLVEQYVKRDGDRLEWVSLELAATRFSRLRSQRRSRR